MDEDTCGANYPGGWQPTTCTLSTDQHDWHVDERRGVRWPAVTRLLPTIPQYVQRVPR